MSSTPLALPTIAKKPDPSEVCPPCGRCCRYVAVGIDPPSSVGRVSTILWILYHRGLSVYESHGGDFFLLVPADCANLRPDGLCGVYESRPLICRDYDVEGCEGTSELSAEKTRFDDAASFLAWLKARKKGLFSRCVEAGILPARAGERSLPPATLLGLDAPGSSPDQ